MHPLWMIVEKNCFSSVCGGISETDPPPDRSLGEQKIKEYFLLCSKPVDVPLKRNLPEQGRRIKKTIK